MPSLTGLSTIELLSTSSEFIAAALAVCEFSVCSQQRTHTEPRPLHCCDACDGDYAIVAWVVRSFSADGEMNERASWRCPTLDATTMGFTVARCWPETANIPKVGGAMDATAQELLAVLDCLKAAFDACTADPSLFSVPCIRFSRGDFVPEKAAIVEPYGEDGAGGRVSRHCAGWKFSITVA